MFHGPQRTKPNDFTDPLVMVYEVFIEPCSQFGSAASLRATHGGEAQGRDGETVHSRGAGVRGGRGCVEAAGLQRIMKPRGALIAVGLTVSCFNKRT